MCHAAASRCLFEWKGWPAGGAARLAYFKKVVSVPRLNRIGASLSFEGFTDGDLWIALATFLYVDFLVRAAGVLWHRPRLLTQHHCSY